MRLSQSKIDQIKYTGARRFMTDDAMPGRHIVLCAVFFTLKLGMGKKNYFLLFLLN